MGTLKFSKHFLIFTLKCLLLLSLAMASDLRSGSWIKVVNNLIGVWPYLPKLRAQSWPREPRAVGPRFRPLHSTMRNRWRRRLQRRSRRPWSKWWRDWCWPRRQRSEAKLSSTHETLRWYQGRYDHHLAKYFLTAFYFLGQKACLKLKHLVPTKPVTWLKDTIVSG